MITSLSLTLRGVNICNIKQVYFKELQRELMNVY